MNGPGVLVKSEQDADRSRTALGSVGFRQITPITLDIRIEDHRKEGMQL